MKGNALPQGAEQTLRGKGGLQLSAEPADTPLPEPPAPTSRPHLHDASALRPLARPGPAEDENDDGLHEELETAAEQQQDSDSSGAAGGGRGAGGERRAPGPGLGLRQNRRRAPAAELSPPRESASGSPAARADREGRGGHVRAGPAAAAPPSGAQRATRRAPMNAR